MGSRLISILVLLLGLACVEPVQASNPLLVGVGTPTTSGGGGGCSQATAALALFSDPTHNATAYTTMICGMVTDGTWAKLIFFHTEAQKTAADAKINLLGNSSFNVVTTGTCAFTLDRGIVGDNSSCNGDTGLNPATGISINSFAMGAFLTADHTANAAFTGVTMGTLQSANAYIQSKQSGSPNFTQWSLFQNGGSPITATASSVSGVEFAQLRTAQTAWAAYTNGALTGSDPTSSFGEVLGTCDIMLWSAAIGTPCTGGSVGFYGSDQIGADWAATGMTATDVVNMDTRLKAFMTAIGAPSH